MPGYLYYTYALSLIFLLLSGAVVAQDATASIDVNNFPPATEFMKSMERHTTKRTGHELSEGILLRYAFGEVLSSPDRSAVTANDISEMEAPLSGKEASVKQSDVTMNRARELLLEANSEIYIVAKLMMQADDEDAVGLTGKFLPRYENLSPLATAVVDQSVTRLISQVKSTRIDLTGLSLERSAITREFLTDGCKRRQNRTRIQRGDVGTKDGLTGRPP